MPSNELGLKIVTGHNQVYESVYWTWILSRFFLVFLLKLYAAIGQNRYLALPKRGTTFVVMEDELADCI